MKLTITTIMLFFILAGYGQSGFKTYNDTLNIYSITYPENYSVKKENETTVLVIAPMDAKYNYQQRLVINLSRAPEGMPIDTIANLLRANLKKGFNESLSFIKNSGQINKTVIDGQEGREIFYQGLTENGIIRTNEFVIVYKGVMLRINSSYKYSIGDESNETFTDVIKSFKFKG